MIRACTFVILSTLILSCENTEKVSRTPAPLPDISSGPTISPEKGYRVEELGKGLYLVTNGIYVTMFLTTGNGIIAVDAPPSIGDKYLKAIREVSDEPITHVIYSHPHADHISAASMFPPEVIYISHDETADVLRKREKSGRKVPFGTFSGGSPVPQPNITFNDKYDLKVGDQVLELSYRGLNHEQGNIFIFAPEQKVLMFVDVVDPGWIPFKGLAHADNTLGYIESYNDILSFDFEWFIGGHLNRPGTREDVKLHGEYMIDLEASASEAIRSISFSSIAQETGYSNPFFLFDSYLDAVAGKCEDLMLPKWTGRLGGADIFTIDNCSQMISSLRLE